MSQRLTAFVRRAGADSAEAHRLRPRILQDGLIADRGQGRRMVHWRHADREGVGRAGVVAAIGDSAVILRIYRYRCHAVGVCRCRKRQRPVGRNRRRHAEQTVVVVAHEERQRLRTFVRRTHTDVGQEVRVGLPARILQHRHVVGGQAEARRIVRASVW